MAADPVAAANALAGQTYAGAQERTAATQKALLDNMAATGTYQNTVNQAATTAASPTAPPPPVDPNTIMGNTQQALAGAGAQQINTMGHAALAAATALAAHQAQQQAASAQTFGQNVAAALPLEQSRASSLGAQILGDLEAKREAAAAAKAHDAIQLQIEQAQLAQVKAAAANKVNGLTADQAVTVKDKMATNALDAAMPQAAYAAVDPQTGKPTGGYNAKGQAIHDITQAGLSLQDALNRNGLSQSDAAEIARQANIYYQSLNQQDYYKTFGGQPPVIALPAVQGGLQDTLMNLASGTPLNGGIPSAADRPSQFAGITASGNVSGPSPAPRTVPVFGPTGVIIGYKPA